MNKTTYNRKYYLHRRVKATGCQLQLKKTTKTINIFPDKANSIAQNKYVSELREKYSYGVQIINPMLK